MSASRTPRLRRGKSRAKTLRQQSPTCTTVFSGSFCASPPRRDVVVQHALLDATRI